jgi:hypothetical protein
MLTTTLLEGKGLGRLRSLVSGDSGLPATTTITAAVSRLLELLEQLLPYNPCYLCSGGFGLPFAGG